MENLTIEELCKFVKQFGKKGTDPMGNTMITMEIVIDQCVPDYIESDNSYMVVQNNFQNFVLDNKFEREPQVGSLHMWESYRKTIYNDSGNGLPEGVSTLVIKLPGYDFDTHYRGEIAEHKVKIGTRELIMYPCQKKVEILMFMVS